MTTLTATANADGGSVRLQLTPTGTVTGITRTDRNGTAPVRVPAGTFPRSGALELDDYEAALVGSVRYTAGGASASVTLGTARPWLVAPLRPAMSQPVEMVLDYRAGRQSLGTLHQVIDRPDPLVSLGRLSTRSGALVAWVTDHAAARAVENMIDRAGIVFYKQADHAGMDMYLTAISTELSPDPDEGWQVAIQYQEVSRPTSPIDETRWTFADVSHAYASFRNVSSSYSNFESLALNDQGGWI